MAAVVGSRLVELLADNSKLKQGLSAAGHDITGLENRSKQSLGRMDSSFSARFAAMGRSAMSFAATVGTIGGIIGAGMAAGVAATRKAAQAILEVGDAAERAGVSVQSFSELRFVAERNRVGVDALIDGLKELQLRADEFIVTGAGSAAESFKRLGYSAEELNDKLKDPSALFTEIIGKLEKLEKAAQIRVADELFGGTGGEQFVQLIEQGEQGIRDAIQAGKALGVVINDDLVTKASELETAFNDVSTAVSSGLHQAIVNASWALFDFLQQFQDVESRTTASLENKLRDLGQQRVEVEYKILELEAAIRDWAGSDQALGAMRTQLTLLKQEMADIADQEAPIVQALDSRTPATAPTSSTVPTVPGSGTTTKAETDAVAERIAALRQELALVGQSENQKRIMNELRAAGVDLTSQEGQVIASLVTQIGAENEALAAQQAAIEANQQAMEEFGSLAKDTMSSFISDLRDGESLTDALGNAFDRLADKLIDMALDTPINGRFSSLERMAA